MSNPTPYTHDQIALMAKLVPGIVRFRSFEDFSDNSGHGLFTYFVADGSAWQPWSDWRDLGPLWLACGKWYSANLGQISSEVRQLFELAVDGFCLGDFDAFATAVCNLAVEIGKVM